MEGKLGSVELDEFMTVEEAVLALCKTLIEAGYEPVCVEPYQRLAESLWRGR